MKKPVINSSNHATALPIWKTIVIVLALHQFNTPAWLWVVAGVILFFIWLGCSIAISREQEIDMFPGDKDTDNERFVEFHESKKYPSQID